MKRRFRILQKREAPKVFVQTFGTIHISCSPGVSIGDIIKIDTTFEGGGGMFRVVEIKNASEVSVVAVK